MYCVLFKSILNLCHAVQGEGKEVGYLLGSVTLRTL